MCVDHTHWGITTIPKNGMLGVTELSYHFWYDIHTSFFTVWVVGLVVTKLSPVTYEVKSMVKYGSDMPISSWHNRGEKLPGLVASEVPLPEDSEGQTLPAPVMPEPVLPSDSDATEEVGSTPDCTSSPDIPANESLTSANAAPTTENSSMIRTPPTPKVYPRRVHQRPDRYEPTI